MTFPAFGHRRSEHTPGRGHRFQQVIAERPLRLWVVTQTTQAYHLDFHHWVCHSTGPLPLTWDQWRSVRLHSAGQALVWPDGLTYRMDDFLHDEHIGSRHGLVRVTRLTSPQALYRPLLNHLPSEATHRDNLQADVLRRYDMDVTTLLDLSQQYAAPPPLLYRRLLDLVLALEHAYSLTEDGVRDLLNWRWHGHLRRTASHWPTPRASIECGDLAQVEATLYPHVPSGAWR